MYLALDPGMTTGFAIFSEEGEIIWIGEKDMSRMDEWLETLGGDFKAIILESYSLYPHVPQMYSKMETVQVIGKIKSWAHKRGIPIVEQAPELRKIGYKYMGKKIPSKKADSHRLDALAHGVYFLQRTGIREFSNVGKAQANGH